MTFLLKMPCNLFVYSLPAFLSMMLICNLRKNLVNRKQTWQCHSCFNTIVTQNPKKRLNFQTKDREIPFAISNDITCSIAYERVHALHTCSEKGMQPVRLALAATFVIVML